MKRNAIITAFSALGLVVSANVMAADMQSQNIGQNSSQIQNTNPKYDALLKLGVNDLEGRSVKNAQGEDIGEVDNVARSNLDGKIYAVVAVGGFIGIGEKEIAVPLDQLELQGENVQMLTSQSQEALEQAANEYQENNYREVGDDQQLAQLVKQGERRIQMSFSELDTNGDGKISKSEAQTNPTLAQKWNDIDRDQNQEVDKAEFSAFEVLEQPGGKEHQ